MTTFKLGKLAPKLGDGLTVPLTDYLAELPLPPVAVDWAAKLPAQLGMMLNDQIGDCTCAAVGHSIQVVTGNAAVEVTIPDAAVLKAYEAISGYDPETGANDNGAAETDVLNYWRRTGVAGHRITASGTIDPKNTTLVKQIVALFGFLYIGVEVPKAWETGPEIWDIPASRSEKAIVGGHAIIVVGYDAEYLYIVSWGRVYRMTWRAFEKYCDEAHGVVTPEWIAATGLSPSGLDIVSLQRDLASVA